MPQRGPAQTHHVNPLLRPRSTSRGTTTRLPLAAAECSGVRCHSTRVFGVDICALLEQRKPSPRQLFSLPRQYATRTLSCPAHFHWHYTEPCPKYSGLPRTRLGSLLPRFCHSQMPILLLLGPLLSRLTAWLRLVFCTPCSLTPPRALCFPFFRVSRTLFVTSLTRFSRTLCFFPHDLFVCILPLRSILSRIITVLHPTLLNDPFVSPLAFLAHIHPINDTQFLILLS